MIVAVALNQMIWIYVRTKIAYKTNAIIGIIETHRQRVWLMIEKFEVVADLTTETEETDLAPHTEIIAPDQGITIVQDLEIDPDPQ